MLKVINNKIRWITHTLAVMIIAIIVMFACTAAQGEKNA